MKYGQVLFVVVVVCAFVAIRDVQATIGIDTSSQVCKTLNPGSFSCLVRNGYKFAILQVWQGGYGYNDNIANCVKWAWDAGMAHVDVYIFMCPNCRGNNPPESVVEQVINNLKKQNVKYGMIWFDIEQCDGCWNDAASNVAFIHRAVDKAVQMGAHVGIYSSEYEWGATFGDDHSFTQYPLWYAHWDGVPNFNDGLYRFGGWTHPAIKQYNDHGPCFDVDVNWYPDGWYEKQLASFNSTLNVH